MFHVKLFGTIDTLGKSLANLMLARGFAPSGIKCHGALLNFASASTLSPNFVGSSLSMTRLASVSSRGISNKGRFAKVC
jgi:hypothetical protein